MDIESIRDLWNDEEYELSIEVVGRMEQREVTLDNIGEALTNGRIISERRRGKPHTSYTVQGWANRQLAGLTIGPQALNVACAVLDQLFIITVYWEEEP